MSEIIPAADLAPTSPPTPPPRKGRPVLAWLVIVGTIAFLLWRNREAPPSLLEALDLVAMRMQARLYVGLASLPASGGKLRDVYVQAEKVLNRGGYEQRLRFAVVAGELAGPAEARKRLRELEQARDQGKVHASEEDRQLALLLDRLYAGYEGEPAGRRKPDLSGDELQELRQRLGWFGELALAPPGAADGAERERALAPAQRTFWGFTGFLLAGLFIGFLGFVVLVVMLVLLAVGRLHGGLRTGSRHGGVYAETFALYLLTFIGLSYGLRFIPAGNSRLLLSGVAAVGSLVVLAWPVLRGVPWRQVRQEIGWTAGRRPALEPLVGVGTYAAAVPLFILGLLVMLVLKGIQDVVQGPPDPFGPSGAPGHPITAVVNNPSVWLWVQVFLVASVAAPVVEETMFRGVLYRHLREATGRAGRPLSVVIAAVITSFVFAVIHPQGLLGVPVLMGLALAFNLAREWRGTLIPAMIAHGINNGAVTLLLYFVAT
jgi:membrane protease YdiL (CAAX protease family)